MKRKHLMRNRLLSSAMAVCMAVSPAVYAAAEETTAAETETAAAQQRLKLLQRVRQQRQREKPPQRLKAKAVTSKTW